MLRRRDITKVLFAVLSVAAAVVIVVSFVFTRSSDVDRRTYVDDIRAFYLVQAGLEYAMREQVQGRSPWIDRKEYDDGWFSVMQDRDNSRAVVTGHVGLVKCTHSIGLPAR